MSERKITTHPNNPRLRIAVTIEDLQDLFADHNVTVELREGGEITLQFPPDPKFPTDNKIPKPEITSGMPESQKIDREVRFTIRSLVTPHFRRITSTASHVGDFCIMPENKEKYGIVKARKRAGEPFTISFITPKHAERFFNLIKGNT